MCMLDMRIFIFDNFATLSVRIYTFLFLPVPFKPTSMYIDVDDKLIEFLRHGMILTRRLKIYWRG